ncbi:MAG: Gfo/Idh/MocA family oxidoreductase [Armatimonadetes bacterium]|nr:Gfo/Idh/MocA family oxidoreductase [Armatimonadota bacterium]
MRIGIVDLDSSHPETFIRRLRELGGAEVSCVYDSGDVHAAGYAERFAKQHGIPDVAESIAEMAGRVDGALVLGVNWDAHLERSRPLLEAGIPVFVDKPVFGKLAHGYALHDIAYRASTPLMGGSTIRYDDKVIAFREEVGAWPRVETAFACGPGTFFYYGIHTAELCHTVLGGSIKKVRLCGEARELFEVVYTDGKVVRLELQSARPPFLGVFATNKAPASVVANGRSNGLIGAFLKMVETKEPPIPFETTLETTAVMIAVHRARTAPGWVYLDDLPLDEGPDGAAFCAWYAADERRVGRA